MIADHLIAAFYKYTGLILWIGDKVAFEWEQLLLMIAVQLALADGLNELKDYKRPVAQAIFWWIVLCYMALGRGLG